MLEGGLGAFAFIGGVVRVHEEERAGLQLAIHATGGLVHQRAGAGARDQRHGQARGLDQRAGIGGGLHCVGDGCAPLGRAAQVLCAAVVGLQACEMQARLGCHGLGQGERRRAGRHAAAALADVDLHEHVDAGVAARHAHGLGQAGDAFFAVHRDGQPAAAGGQLRGQACRAQ